MILEKPIRDAFANARFTTETDACVVADLLNRLQEVSYPDVGACTVLRAQSAKERAAGIKHQLGFVL